MLHSHRNRRTLGESHSLWKEACQLLLTGMLIKSNWNELAIINCNQLNWLLLQATSLKQPNWHCSRSGIGGKRLCYLTKESANLVEIIQNDRIKHDNLTAFIGQIYGKLFFIRQFIHSSISLSVHALNRAIQTIESLQTSFQCITCVCSIPFWEQSIDCLARLTDSAFWL